MGVLGDGKGSFMSKRRGFTLIELLVVVTVLALLMALLLPSLKRARTQTKRTVCAANLRQIGVGLQAYLSENQDRFPWASFLPSAGPFPLDVDEPVHIADVLMPFLSGESAVFRCPDDRPLARRPAPNTGKSYFESERSSYEYRWRPSLGGKTVTEVANFIEQFIGRTLADNTLWILRDYDNFHGPGGQAGARRYLYADGHVTDFEN